MSVLRFTSNLCRRNRLKMTGLEFFSHVYPASAALTVFDIGAHTGESVGSFQSLFPQAQIHAFEPAPDNFLRLRDRFLGQPAIHPHQAAVGAFDGFTKLHLNNYSATHSVLPIDRVEINRWADSADFAETGVLEVEQRSIDRLIADHGLTGIDILKMDVQGGELLVLNGARAALAAHRIGCIFSEVEFRALYTGQPLAWDIHSCLSGLGYQFVNFACPKITDTGLLSWADAIYVNPTIWNQLAQRHSAGKAQSQ